MRISGFKRCLFAAGLAVALGGQALAATAPAPAPAAPAAAAANESAPVQAQQPAAAPVTAAAQPAAAPAPAALLPQPGVGQPVDRGLNTQPQATPTGRQAEAFHNYFLLPTITAISLFVLGLLLWVMFRYRRAANPVPSKTSHNTTIEVIWTAVPVVILVVLAVPSIQLLAAQYEPAPANAVTLKATGNQWNWTHQYPDHGGFEITSNMLKERDQVGPNERFRTDADGPRLLAVDNRIVLPVGVPIRLQTTAADVIHSWAMPAFWVKLDAVPGRINELSFTIDRPGLYFGQCSELCGARHAYMPIAVEAVSPEQFAAWVRSKGGTMPGEAAATPATPAPANAAAPAAPAAPETNQAAPAEAAAGNASN